MLGTYTLRKPLLINFGLLFLSTMVCLLKPERFFLQELNIQCVSPFYFTMSVNMKVRTKGRIIILEDLVSYSLKSFLSGLV